MNLHVYMLEKAIERVNALDWRVMQAISRGARRLDLVSTDHIVLNLEKNEYSNSGSVSLHEIRDGKENWLTSYLPSQMSHTCQDRFVGYMKKLIILSRVSERLGYEQTRFNYSERKVGDSRIYFNMHSDSTVEMGLDRSSYERFMFEEEEDLVQKIAGFERKYSTAESIASMSPALRDLVVKGEIA